MRCSRPGLKMNLEKKKTRSNNKWEKGIKIVEVKFLTKQEEEECWKCIIYYESKDVCVIVIRVVV